MISSPYNEYARAIDHVRGDWQVIAFGRLRGQVRNFAVSRIEEWKLLKVKRFTRDPISRSNPTWPRAFWPSMATPRLRS